MKKIINFLILIFFLILTYIIIIDNDLVTNSILLSFELWKTKLFPSLFPFFIISDFLINYGFADILSNILYYPFKILFKTSRISIFVFVMSMISGFPSSSKYINDLLNNNLIEEAEATKLLMFTHFSNPLFILSFIHNYLEFKYCIIILISHYICNILIGILFRNLYSNDNKSKKNIQKKQFNQVLKDSISNTINTLLLILGTVTFFMIITSIINNLNINDNLKLFLNCIFEITNGINYINRINLAIHNKIILITMMLSFGGLSVHFQVLSILDNKKIKYQYYLLSRILHSIISGILAFILLLPLSI